MHRSERPATAAFEEHEGAAERHQRERGEQQRHGRVLTRRREVGTVSLSGRSRGRRLGHRGGGHRQRSVDIGDRSVALGCHCPLAMCHIGAGSRLGGEFHRLGEGCIRSLVDGAGGLLIEAVDRIDGGREIGCRFTGRHRRSRSRDRHRDLTGRGERIALALVLEHLVFGDDTVIGVSGDRQFRTRAVLEGLAGGDDRSPEAFSQVEDETGSVSPEHTPLLHAELQRTVGRVLLEPDSRLAERIGVRHLVVGGHELEVVGIEEFSIRPVHGERVGFWIRGVRRHHRRDVEHVVGYVPLNIEGLELPELAFEQAHRGGVGRATRCHHEAGRGHERDAQHCRQPLPQTSTGSPPRALRSGWLRR